MGRDEPAMSITAETRVYGIFGHPVGHSFSPRMHNAAFDALGLDCVYVAFDVEPGSLRPATLALKALSIAGVNVTIPHKQAIIEHLDFIAPEARFTGAVNTVHNSGGTLEGHNTDVGGFLRALSGELGFEPAGARVVVLGAGGAARAVLSGLGMKGAAEVAIVNRTLPKGAEMADYFAQSFPDTGFGAHALGDTTALKGLLGGADLLVNATSGGMEGSGELSLPLESLATGAVVYDLVYNPEETKLVGEARRLGHRAAPGLGMLLYQGAESFRIWTGLDAPLDAMREALGSG